MVIVFACIISVSLWLSGNNNDKTLAESMEETKIEKSKIEELMSQVNEELINNGYKGIGLSFSYDLHMITVQVHDKKFSNRNEKKIKTLIYNIAKEIKLDSIKIQFETIDLYSNLNGENKNSELPNEVVLNISKLLEDKGYRFSSISFDPRTANPNIEIKIEGTEDYYYNVRDEIQKLVSNATFLNKKMNIEVSVKRRSENEIKNEIRDQNWQPIFSAIREETDKKFKEYRGFAYSFHPKPLQIIIKTNLPKSKWYWNSNKKIVQIEDYVNEIIKIKMKELSVEEIPYEIIIRNRDNKKIN